MANDMVTGGLAVSFVVGYSGPDVRSDVEITVRSASKFSYEFRSNCSPLYDEAITTQIEAVARQFGEPAFHFYCVDSGALPMTWSARLTAAFCLALGVPIPRAESQKQYVGTGLRRTRLYVPSNTPKLIPNVPLFRPDAVILDLEESVHTDRKVEALAIAASVCGAVDWSGIELMVRINPGAQGEIDVVTLAQSSVATYIVPKVDCPEDILQITELLNDTGSSAKVIPLIESALGVENSFAIATCSPRITALSLGMEDYVADIGATRTTDQSESAYARSRVLNAARAAGVMPLASVFPRFHDPLEVETYARTARLAGYEGIGCIHPNQIEAAHIGFLAEPEELENARKVVQAYVSAQMQGSGVVGVNGSMADLPTYRRAQRLIELSKGGCD
ncbi:MAG: aldolase/citrate lyase family protein [Fimbriimonadaceae bacterium]